MGLKDHKFALDELHVSQDDLGTLLQEQVVHHPIWQIAHAFFSREFKDTTVSFLAHLCIADHKEHGIGYVQAGELVQSRRWQDNYIKNG